MTDKQFQILHADIEDIRVGLRKRFDEVRAEMRKESEDLHDKLVGVAGGLADLKVQVERLNENLEREAEREPRRAPINPLRRIKHWRM